MADNKYRLKLQLGNGTEIDAGVIVVPQGEKGEKGSTGPQGAQGIQGETGAKGDTGETGKTAYQYAQESGYSGTEAEYAESVNPEKISGRLSAHDKRLQNLEQALYPDIVTPVADSAVAYAKAVPKNVLPYAEVTQVGGMTYKAKNLFFCSEDTTATNGSGLTITTTKNTSSIKLNGTVSADSSHSFKGKANITLPQGTYTMSAYGLNVLTTDTSMDRLFILDATSGLVIINNIMSNAPKTFTLAEETTISISLVTGVGSSYSDKEINIMLNEGSAALPYEPYFDTLRSAPVTSIESVGKNIFDADNAEMVAENGVSVTKIENGIRATLRNAGSWRSATFKLIDDIDKVRGKTVIASSLFEAFNTAKKALVALQLIGASGSLMTSTTVSSGESNKSIEKLTVPQNTEATRLVFMLYATGGGGGEAGDYADFTNIQVEIAAAATDYAPYTKTTLPIPNAVQALEGYGEGVSDECFNYIDFVKKQFVKRVGKVDMGTLTWKSDGSTKYLYVPTLNVKGYGEVLTSELPIGVKSVSVDRVADLVAYFEDTPLTVAELTAAMSGVMLYYELAEPVITDISHLLPDDNYIPVEGGGMITMQNEYGYAVPSTVEYTVKGASAQ